MSGQVYVVSAGQKEGPYSMEVVASMVASGAVSSTSQCWQEGMTDWQPLEEVFPQLLVSIPPPLAFVTNPKTVAPVLHLAAVFDRILAGIIDGFILTVLGVVFTLVIPGIGGLLTTAIYLVFFMSNQQFQGTLGMKAMNIKVVDVAGNTISVATSFVRYFMSIVSAFVLFIGYFMIFFTKKNQTLHDQVAGTYVVKR